MTRKEASMLAASRYSLNKVKLLHLLEEMKANSIEVGSLCVPPRSSKTSIQGLLENIPDTRTAPEDLSQLITNSSTGAMLFWGMNHRYLVLPPFPIADERFSRTCEIEPLYSLLHRQFILGLVLVRLGAYGIGILQGEKVLSSKVGTGLVHARHRQGGSSSHRFERHRDKQMETFFTRICQHAREQLEPQLGKLDYILYGGTQETITEFRRQCHFLRQFEPKTLDRLLNIREPNQSGLKEAVQEAWSSRVIEWKEN